MKNLEKLYYTKEHEWTRLLEDNLVEIGITDYAQEQLGDIVFVELPEEEEEIEIGDPIGVIESVKTVSDFYAPVSGEIAEINSEVLDNPELLNEKPYEAGWLIRIKMSEPDEINDLMEYGDYVEFLEEESH